jgi:hypothetical protein
MINFVKFFENKLRTSTKMKHLDGLVCWWRNWNLGIFQGLMPTRGWGEPWEFTRGLPLRIKEITMSSMVRVLPVQPYDTMGSVLIEYDARVQPRVLTWGGSWLIGGTVRLLWLHASSESSCLNLFFGGKMSLKVKVRNPRRVSNLSV